MTDRHQYVGTGVVDTLLFAIGAQDQTLSGTALTGWPVSGNPFVVIVGRGGPTEEKILCASRSGGTLMVATSGRGYDGTAQQAHAAGEPMILYIAAVEIDQLNAHGANVLLDEHTQYMQASGTRHDLTARHLIGTTLPAPAAPTVSAPSDVGNRGVATAAARGDHLHGREAAPSYTHDFRNHWFGPVGTLILGGGSIYFVPFRVWAPVTVSQVQLNLTAAGSSNNNVFAAIYADAGGRPATSPTSAAPFVSGFTTGVITLNLGATALTTGIWWVGIKSSASAGTPTVTSTSAPLSESFDVTNPNAPSASGPGFVTSITEVGMTFAVGDLGVGSDVPLVFGIS